MSESSVVDFYAGKSVLITGATGFIGKVLLAKLLNACGEIDKIYLLIRSNRNATSTQRIENLLKSQAFSEKIVSIEKVIPIDGDITKPGLGLSENDRKVLVERVSVVFHIAANVKFNGPIKEFVEQNVLGTQSVMELANEMKNLQSLVYVSTAYSNTNLSEVEEKVYPVSSKPVQFLVGKILSENSNDDKIPSAGDPVLLGRPNSYTISKAIAENVIQQPAYQHLPVLIARPSIVAHSVRDPVEGWCDSLNGAAGLVLCAQLGILGTMKVNSDYVSDIIPVDFVANSLIVLGWHTAIAGQNKRKSVVHLTTGENNPITWGDFCICLRKSFFRWPSTKMVRPFIGRDICVKPGFFGNIKYHFLRLFLHYIFAFILDSVLLIKGKPKMMIKAVQKMERACETMTFFTTNQWHFHGRNYQQIHKSLSENEQELFLSDVKRLNWQNYLDTIMIGNRRYLLKEDDSNLKVARNKLRKVALIQEALSLVFKIGFFAIGLYFVRLLFKAYWTI